MRVARLRGWGSGGRHPSGQKTDFTIRVCKYAAVLSVYARTGERWMPGVRGLCIVIAVEKAYTFARATARPSTVGVSRPAPGVDTHAHQYAHTMATTPQ